MTMRPIFKVLAFGITSLAPFLARSIAAPENASTAMASPFSQENLVTDLSRDLSAHYNLEGDLQLELLRAWNSPDRVASNWQVQVLEYPTLPASSMLLRCRVLADGNPVGETTFVLRASLWREVWIARQPLTNGAVFDPSLLDTRRVDLFRERDVVPATVGDRTFIFSRSVQAGRSLTWRDIGRRPLIRKGDVVDVSASDGMLVISMKALAMQNGAQGEAVTVRNLESRKDFTAFVVDENHVQVRF